MTGPAATYCLRPQQAASYARYVADVSRGLDPVAAWRAHQRRVGVEPDPIGPLLVEVPRA